MSLAKRLMLGMVALVLAAAVAIGVVAYQSLVSSIYPAQLAQMESDAGRLAESLDAAVREAVGDVAVLAAAPAIKSAIAARVSGDKAKESAWKAQVAALFVATLKAKPEYLQLRMIGIEDSGREIVRAERGSVDHVIRVVPESRLQTKGARQYYKRTLQLPPDGVYVSSIELNREFGDVEIPWVPVVRVAIPVYDPAGRLFGMVIINIDLREAFRRLRLAIDPGMNVYVTNLQGDYLVHRNPLREFAFEFGKPDRLQAEFPVLAGLLAANGAPVELSRRIVDEEGEDFALAGAVRRLTGDIGIAVVLTAPSEQILAPADEILGSATKVGLVAILTAVLLAYLLSRTIAQPLERLARSVDRFDRGEGVALPVHAPREIGILITAFQRHIERERLFNAAVQSSTDAILTQSLDGRITAWNHAAEALFGYTADEIAGQPLMILVPPDRKEEYRELRANVMKGLATGPIETVRVAKDGRRADVSLTISPVRALSGEITGASVICRDITVQKRADAMFRLAVDASPAAMIMTDGEGRIALANTEAMAIFGFPAEELIGMRIEELMPERVRDQHRALRHGFMPQPSKRNMGSGRDLRGRRRDGTEFPLEIALNPIDGPKGPMTLSVVVDITERKKNERALQQAKQAAEQASAMKSQFLASMSHELRTPLNAIIGYSEMMLLGVAGKVQPSRYGSYVEDIHKGGLHLLSLINDLLDLSKAESGKLELVEEDFDLAELVREATDMLRGQAESKGVSLSVLSELPSNPVCADPRMIKQILLNLVGNAIKFTPQGGEIDVAVDRTEADEATIVVRDTGIGIHSHQLEQAFEPFVQVPNAYLRSDNCGTGLGLALCKSYVEMHQGTIGLESAIGVGTTLTVILPARRSLAYRQAGDQAMSLLERGAKRRRGSSDAAG